MTILNLLTAGGFAVMIICLMAISYNLSKASDELRKALEAFMVIQTYWAAFVERIESERA